MMNKELCQDIENTKNKISCSEEKLKHAENQLRKEKQDCEMRENVDMLISEIEEELNKPVSNFLWFILQQ